MFNFPQRQKYKKKHKLFVNRIAFTTCLLRHGTFGLKAVEGGYISSKQIEAARKAIVKRIKRIGKIYIRIHPSLGVTNKPVETRMGKGKGNIVYWVAVINPGRVLFEISGITKSKADEVFRLGAIKLSVKTRIISLND